tara:strand:+ start:540 stop:761 length:222 start_codon:yes stop_codon:yes gene_type:complete
MAKQDLILGKGVATGGPGKIPLSISKRHTAQSTIDPKKAAKDTAKRREKDEEELRQLLQDLIRTEITKLFVKK